MPADDRDQKFERALAQHLRRGSAQTGCPDAETLAAYQERSMSPGDMARDVEQKARDWLTAGAQQVWVINPQLKTVTVYSSGGSETLREADILGGGAVVPGFQISVAEIFAI